ncbi:hypothetical protein L1276_001082 [Flavobacterium sp. HSC-32F16]|uniref:hypothetical protein n=1 Tax=Flavobacterium sp. HSC-32F16 TaxID=2910964 RepID=UPI0020A3D855|nr:hypothetical protein [Flavobacterium sp. HSC-32F16]MCP2025942.1 hypothetical protein [Flavobacterium sp. HSC-32F16]
MKKLITILILLLTIKGQAQTYSFSYSYSSQGTRCTDGVHGWQLDIQATPSVGFRETTNASQYPPNISYKPYTIKTNPTRFDFKVWAYDCTSSPSCDPTLSKTFTLVELIKARAVTIWDCKGYQRFAIDGFQPNVAIKNLDTANPNSICAGGQVSLAAFPTELIPGNSDFPPEAYHWQYSLDNKVSWIDVPAYINGIKTNDIATTKFSINELLPTTHDNYFNQIIYLKLAYGNVTPIGILYSPCAPLVSKIEYSRPLCYGDNIPNVTVTFSRNLYTQEELRYFQLLAVDPITNTPNGTPPVSFPFTIEGDPNNGLIKKFEEKTPNVFTYTLTNFKGLTDKAMYQVKYQAFQNNVTRGVSISPKAQNFTYEEYEPVKFKIIKAENPKCAGELVGVSIEVTGGTKSYEFYVDGIKVNAVKNQNDGFYYITGLNPAATNNIKVVDTNDCFEKNV